MFSGGASSRPATAPAASGRGARQPGPPMGLFVLGASNYLTEVAPEVAHKPIPQTLVAEYPPTVTHGGPAKATLVKPVGAGEGAADVDALAATAREAAHAAAPPKAVFHDLKATAEAHTAALLERESEVLRYRVALVEPVRGEAGPETSRTRLFDVVYHGVDGSLSMFEPPVLNSGLMQGPFARRHVPLKPDGSGPYTPADLLIGAPLHVYGRDFTVLDADAGTRAHLASKYGISLAPAAAAPAAPVPFSASTIGAITPGGPAPADEALGTATLKTPGKLAFAVGLEEDPETGGYRRGGPRFNPVSGTLKFEAEWRETGAAFTDRRRFVLQYFLEDDTVEILDRTSTYTSGGLFSKFYLRQRLPRLPIEPGMEAGVPADVAAAENAAAVAAATGAAVGTSHGVSRTRAEVKLHLPPAEAVLAAARTARAAYKPVAGSSTRGKIVSPITGRPAFDPLEGTHVSSASTGATTTVNASGVITSVAGVPVLTATADKPDYATAADFICGGIVSVFGRPLLLKSCDPFTVAFGLAKMGGIDQRATFVTEEVLPPAIGRVPLPPHVGPLALGSEEETRANAGKLLPTYRTGMDFNRFNQLGSRALRFEAVLDPSLSDPEDARRRFVVTYYLGDETLLIAELTGIPAGRGPGVVRYLQRGKYRNAAGGPDPAAAAALGLLPPDASMPPAVLAVYDKLAGAAKDKVGYASASGAQGYGGGLYGRAERVGAGGTGVAAPGDVGVRDAALHSTPPPARFFKAGDFYPGASIRLAHTPSTVFVLGRPDLFTAAYLRAAAATGIPLDVLDPKDVYVPEQLGASSSSGVAPALPLEAGADADGATTAEAAAASGDLEAASLILAKVLAGVAGSAKAVIKQADKLQRRIAPRALVATVLRSYGVCPPACPDAALETVLDAFVVDASNRPPETDLAPSIARTQKVAWKHAPTALLMRPASASAASPARPATAPPAPSPSSLAAGCTISTAAGGLTPRTCADALTGRQLRDFAGPEFAATPMVDYNKLFMHLGIVADRAVAALPRTELVMSQLRSAVLSSRTHMRRVFRDLDTTGAGIITLSEFRRLLSRHNLDGGMSDAQLKAFMARLPPASPSAAAAAGGEPCVSWTGFIGALLEAKSLSTTEVELFTEFVAGLRPERREAVLAGVGGSHQVPELFEHVNAVSHWAPDAVDPTPYLAALGGAAASAAPSSGVPSGASSVAGSRRSGPPTPEAAPAPVRAAAADSRVTFAGLPEVDPEAARSARGSAVTPTKMHVGLRPAGSSPGSISTASAWVPPTKRAAAAAAGAVDAVAALSAAGPTGAALLSSLRSAFAPRRFELYSALHLYDPGRTHTLGLPSFVSALQSAGAKLPDTHLAALRAVLLAAAGPVPHEADAKIAYEAFFDGLFPSEAAAALEGALASLGASAVAAH